MKNSKSPVMRLLKKYGRYWLPFVLVCSTLTISLWIVVRDSKENDSIESLLFVSPVSIAEERYPYFQFILPESVIGTTGTLIVESEFRTANDVVTQTIEIDIDVEVVEVGSNAFIARWAIVDPGEEWLRGTLHIVESERVEHQFYGRLYVGHAAVARSDDRRFYYHRSVEPFTLLIPIVMREYQR